MKNIKLIAFYLPQFYPFKENNEWWGEGFTEWTNVGKAKKYYPGHDQPKVPADLGYYDLRLPENRMKQAQLAKDAGISAFCYWHYWFGNGKQLLNEVLEEVVEQGKPDFPFCLGWANHTWSKKNWNNKVSRFNNETLIEQKYPSKKDIDEHFYKMLPAFKDNRYFKVHDKLLFFIYDPLNLPNIDFFIKRWNELAVINNIPSFYFVGNYTGGKQEELEQLENSLDAVALDLKNKAFGHDKFRIIKRRLSYLFPFPINVIRYSSAIKKMVTPLYAKEKIYPVVYPNWDHSPRVGISGTIMHGSTPKLWGRYLRIVLSLICNKPKEDQVVFIKSWNEWAEGNYLEPDLKYGKSYLKEIFNILNETSE